MLSLLLLAAAGSQPTPASPALKPICEPQGLSRIDTRSPARAHKLNEEPPARQIYTVLRTEDGCTRPVPVNDRRFGDGAR